MDTTVGGCLAIKETRCRIRHTANRQCNDKLGWTPLRMDVRHLGMTAVAEKQCNDERSWALLRVSDYVSRRPWAVKNALQISSAMTSKAGQYDGRLSLAVMTSDAKQNAQQRGSATIS